MLRVLIVDDDFNIREGLRKLIDWEQMDCRIVGTACNSFEALDYIRASSVDIVITDIRMPEMDGLQFIRKVRNESRNVQFIILSAYSNFDYAKEAIRSEVVDYLVKPVEERELINVINRTKTRMEKYRVDRQELFSMLENNLYIQIENSKALSRHSVNVIRYIVEHYKEKINIDHLAAVLYVNPAYLGQVFKKETGYSFRDFLNRYRIGRAVEMLSEGGASITEVSEMTGYRYLEHFYRVFKKITGKAPKDYLC